MSFFGRTALEKWTVRRWVSEVNGLASCGEITGGVGNGVIGRIFVDKVAIYTVSVDGGDSIGVNYSVPVNVSIGTTIDFAIDPKAAHDGTDPTRFTAIVDTTILGDYNDDGVVDSADYVVWRKNDGTQAGYDIWRANFGEPTGLGTGAAGASPSQAAAPEPATLVLLMCTATGWCLRRGRTP